MISKTPLSFFWFFTKRGFSRQYYVRLFCGVLLISLLVSAETLTDLTAVPPVKHVKELADPSSSVSHRQRDYIETKQARHLSTRMTLHRHFDFCALIELTKNEELTYKNLYLKILTFITCLPLDFILAKRLFLLKEQSESESESIYVGTIYWPPN